LEPGGALALGCATEDDTSSNGGDGDGGSAGDGDGGSGDESEDMGNLLSQVAGMVTEMAEMSAKIAAQQATIAQLEMQMAETLRWETWEHTCAASDPDGADNRWYEVVDSTVDVPEVLHIVWKYEESESWTTGFESNLHGAAVRSSGLSVTCRSGYSGAFEYRITLGYER
jgi:hypothetical protein